MDDAKRERILQDATRVAMQDVGIIPLHIQKNIWAMRRHLAHEARADELTRAQDVRPAAASAAR
jgi:peptide/nickel transport system substrate-binding protein